MSIALQFISIFLEFLCKALCLISPPAGGLDKMWLPGSLGFQTSLGRQLCPCSVQIIAPELYWFFSESIWPSGYVPQRKKVGEGGVACDPVWGVGPDRGLGTKSTGGLAPATSKGHNPTRDRCHEVPATLTCETKMKIKERLYGLCS